MIERTDTTRHGLQLSEVVDRRITTIEIYRDHNTERPTQFADLLRAMADLIDEKNGTPGNVSFLIDGMTVDAYDGILRVYVRPNE